MYLFYLPACNYLFAILISIFSGIHHANRRIPPSVTSPLVCLSTTTMRRRSLIWDLPQKIHRYSIVAIVQDYQKYRKHEWSLWDPVITTVYDKYDILNLLRKSWRPVGVDAKDAANVGMWLYDFIEWLHYINHFFDMNNNESYRFSFKGRWISQFLGRKIRFTQIQRW